MHEKYRATDNTDIHGSDLSHSGGAVDYRLPTMNYRLVLPAAIKVGHEKTQKHTKEIQKGRPRITQIPTDGPLNPPKGDFEDSTTL